MVIETNLSVNDIAMYYDVHSIMYWFILVFFCFSRMALGQVAHIITQPSNILHWYMSVVIHYQ